MPMRHIRVIILAILGLALFGQATTSMAAQFHLRTVSTRDQGRPYHLTLPNYKGMFSIVTISVPGNFDTTPYRQPVDGVFIKIFWNVIEPQPGVFNFAELDRSITLALQNGKTIIFGVGGGASSPAWLEQPPYNVNSSQFYYSLNKGIFPCQNVIVPWPWDQTYIQQFVIMQRAVAAHLQTIPGALADIVNVKLTGVNTITEELALPTSDGSPGPVCTQSNAQLAWQQAGYRPSKIIASWTTMAAAIANAFPGRLLSTPMLEYGEFPDISEDGSINNGPGDPNWVDVRQAVTTNALHAFPGRFAVNSTNLGAYQQPAFVQAYAAQGAVIGYQGNEYINNNSSGCGPTGLKVCAPASYQALLMNGVNLGAYWLELWSPNVQQFPNDVVRANAAMDKLHP